MRVGMVPSGNWFREFSNIFGSQSNNDVLARSVRRSANLVMRTWVTMLDESAAKPGWKDRYRESIKMEDGGDYASMTIFTESKFASFVEDGIKSFDMKEGLLSGPKARMGKDGTPYTIVPFRHSTPGAKGRPMPKEVYDLAKGLDASVVTGTGKIFNTVRGDKMRAKTYKWGQRLDHQNKRYKGMTRMEQQVKGGSQSQYFTFRVVSAKAVGKWIYPDVPAVKVFGPMSDKVRPQINEIMQKAVIQRAEEGLRYLAGKE